MVVARVSLNDYANKVLNLIKVKYDLNDKSQALNKFVEMYGENELEPKVKESYVKKILAIEENYYKKHSNRRMNDKELDKLFGK
ncbi:MAG: DUF2683 family protein [Candidatus Diapherotrites archaeon]|nr:DUF2683 family protein [Candidatus Diapherotrites archaeon]